MPQPNDLSRSRVPFERDATIVAVVEMSQSSWLVAAIVPGLDRHPLKKIEPDPEALLRLLRRWREEASRAGSTVRRAAVAQGGRPPGGNRCAHVVAEGRVTSARTAPSTFTPSHTASIPTTAMPASTEVTVAVNVTSAPSASSGTTTGRVNRAE